VTKRAIRRLDLLEWIIFLCAVFIATLGGAVVAWLIGEPSGFGFRPTWVAASLVLFVVPGAIALYRLRRDAESWRADTDSNKKETDG
jgi:uncharacterized membrane protein